MFAHVEKRNRLLPDSYAQTQYWLDSTGMLKELLSEVVFLKSLKSGVSC